MNEKTQIQNLFLINVSYDYRWVTHLGIPQLYDLNCLL